jgi:hypothetical protein
MELLLLATLAFVWVVLMVLTVAVCAAVARADQKPVRVPGSRERNGSQALAGSGSRSRGTRAAS